MTRFDPTDFEWSAIQPLLPTKVRRTPLVNDRRARNGIFWRLRTGAPWAVYGLRHLLQTVAAHRALYAHS